ncbi:hypothetical protein [Corynebacterium sp. H130]|uniref:hypothetical protein n=1 Tax=Corynebacterium sp. H130 TaxID=3133444 RepID=UPI0030ADED33
MKKIAVATLATLSVLQTGLLFAVAQEIEIVPDATSISAAQHADVVRVEYEFADASGAPVSVLNADQDFSLRLMLDFSAATPEAETVYRAEGISMREVKLDEMPLHNAHGELVGSLLIEQRGPGVAQIVVKRAAGTEANLDLKAMPVTVFLPKSLYMPVAPKQESTEYQPILALGAGSGTDINFEPVAPLKDVTYRVVQQQPVAKEAPTTEVLPTMPEAVTPSPITTEVTTSPAETAVEAELTSTESASIGEELQSLAAQLEAIVPTTELTTETIPTVEAAPTQTQTEVVAEAQLAGPKDDVALEPKDVHALVAVQDAPMPKADPIVAAPPIEATPVEAPPVADKPVETKPVATTAAVEKAESESSVVQQAQDVATSPTSQDNAVRAEVLDAKQRVENAQKPAVSSANSAVAAVPREEGVRPAAQPAAPSSSAQAAALAARPSAGRQSLARTGASVVGILIVATLMFIAGSSFLAKPRGRHS